MAEKAKAFAVNDSLIHVLVWAATAAEAKRIALRLAWYSDSKYGDLRVRREPTLDGRRRQGYCSGDEPSRDDFRMMRLLGWYDVIIGIVACEICGMHQFSDLPESKIGEDGKCAECAVSEHEGRLS